jgi:hypothetical protein
MPIPSIDCSKNRVKSNCEHETPGPKSASLDVVHGMYTTGGTVSGGNVEFDIEATLSRVEVRDGKG